MAAARRVYTTRPIAGAQGQIDMKSELAQAVFSTVDAQVRSTPSLSEFEFAYQARVAIEKIRFAIKQLDRLTSGTHCIQEVSLQLVDALDRLQSAERKFELRSRTGNRSSILLSASERSVGFSDPRK
jgi:hypothetical protein